MPRAFEKCPTWSRAAPCLPASSSDASGSQVPISSIASSGDPGEGYGLPLATTTKGMCQNAEPSCYSCCDRALNKQSPDLCWPVPLHPDPPSRAFPPTWKELELLRDGPPRGHWAGAAHLHGFGPWGQSCPFWGPLTPEVFGGLALTGQCLKVLPGLLERWVGGLSGLCTTQAPFDSLPWPEKLQAECWALRLGCWPD